MLKNLRNKIRGIIDRRIEELTELHIERYIELSRDDEELETKVFDKWCDILYNEDWENLIDDYIESTIKEEMEDAKDRINDKIRDLMEKPF